MAASGLVINQIYGVVVVNFRNQSILDGASIDAIAADLYALVDEQAHRKMILDFTAVRFLSSQVIGTLLQVDKKIKAIKGKVVICGMKPNLYKVFETMNL
ncbi:MAG TPA: STAS domain-containing protein, partial [Phycisphaerae bacterium]|nr:STAS domain-containing protein [Phycisphaerae bacterium]